MRGAVMLARGGHRGQRRGQLLLLARLLLLGGVARTQEDTPSPATPCTDTDNGLMGRFSYTCASIDDNLDKCTGYDANGFVAGEMCCQCGGGAIPDQGRRRQ